MTKVNIFTQMRIVLNVSILFFPQKITDAFRHVVKEGALAGNVDIFLTILTNADFSFVKLRIDVLQNLPGNLDLLFYDVVC